MSKRASVSLLKIIDPSECPWTLLGHAALPYKKGAPKAATVQWNLFPRLAILTHANKLDPKLSPSVLAEYPVWQYFCGFKNFQCEIAIDEKKFERFFLKIKKYKHWDLTLMRQLVDASKKKKRPKKRKPARLSLVVAENHPLTLAREFVHLPALEILRPESIGLSVFMLALLAEKMAKSKKSHEVLEIFRSNIYWQYFCGMKFFSTKLTEEMAQFTKARRLLRKHKNWKAANNLMAAAFRQSARILESGDPEVSLILLRNSPPTPGRTPRNVFPVERVVKNLEGNLRCSKVASALKANGWKTVFIGSDDLYLAQRGLHGPLLSFIRSSNKEACKKALDGTGSFADVIVVEPTGTSPGKIIYKSYGPEFPNERLEFALSEVKSLDGFLAQPETQKKYFEALSLVYPPQRLYKTSYNAILKQLRDILPEAPLLRERLWSPWPQHAAGFSIEADMPVYGRGFNATEFSKFIDAFLGQSPDYEITSLDSRKIIKKIVDATDTQIREFETALTGEDLERKRTAFYSKLRSSADVQKALRLMLRNCLKGSGVSAYFKEKSSDHLLDYFRRLNLNPSTVLGESEILWFNHSFWISLIRSRLPKVPELLLLNEVFPLSSRKTRRGKTIARESFSKTAYSFAPVSRGLHCLWRGITFNDCVGGQHDELDQLMPERWASSLLKGAIYYNVVKDGGIKGYCQLVPFEHDGATYASIDFQWPPLFNLSSDGMLFFECCLKKFAELIPKSWAGIVIGEHPAGREPYEIEILRGLDCYKNGRSIGTAKNIRFADELAAQISRASEKRGYGSKYRPVYGNHMLTDASLGGESSPITVLKLIRK